MLAIYQLEADRLTVCYDLDGKDRPIDMRPREDQLLLSITYARALTLLS
jgi:hypothetical protein